MTLVTLSLKVTATKLQSAREITISFLQQVGVTTGNVTVINPSDWPTFTWEPARPVTTPAPPRLVRHHVIMHTYTRKDRVTQHYLENGSNHIVVSVKAADLQNILDISYKYFKISFQIYIIVVRKKLHIFTFLL